jgi:hypothetical protein
MTEPRHTSPEVLRLGYPTLGAGGETTLSASLSDRVVGEDRRCLIGLGTEDGQAFRVEFARPRRTGSGATRDVSIVRVIAVRADGLVAASGQSQYVDGAATMAR